MRLALAVLLAAAVPSRADRGIPLSNATHVLLPNGLTLEVKDGGLYVVRDGIRAPAPLPDERPGYLWPVKALTRASATDDKTWVTVKFASECGLEDEAAYSLNSLWARSENAIGMEARLRKEYAAAAKLFARAAQIDPGFAAAVINEASALSLAGRKQDALDALSTLIAKNPAETYLGCLTEPDLAPLLKEPRLEALKAATPGAARLRLEDILSAGQDFSSGRRAAYEPVRRIAAAVVHRRVAVELSDDDIGYRWSSALVFVDARTGAALARFPLVDQGQTAASDSYRKPLPADKGSRAEIERRVELANRALADLGLQTPEQIKPVPEPKRDSGHGKNGYAFPGTNLSLSGPELWKADAKLARVKDAEFLEWASYLPGPGLVVLQWGQHPNEGSKDCPRNAFDGIGVLRP